MAAKSLFMAPSGVLSRKRKLVDGKEHDIHFRAQTPDALATFVAACERVANDAAGTAELQRLRAQFIADTLCNEDGTPLMSFEEARQVPLTLKPELCNMVLRGSNELEQDAKND